MFRLAARCLTLRTGGVLPLRVARIRQPTEVALVWREYTNEKAKYDTIHYDGVCRVIILLNTVDICSYVALNIVHVLVL